MSASTYGNRASLVADLDAHGGVGANGAASGSEALLVAWIDVQLHDVEAATLRIKTTLVNHDSAPDMATAAFARARLAEEQGDLKAAAQEWTTYLTAYSNPTVANDSGGNICWASATFEKIGQSARADDALNAVGRLTYVDCYRFRADLLDRRGDWNSAQQWYAKAVELGPSLPSGYYSWGIALANHGDLVGAAEKLKIANEKSPHWADPLKSWGDVLARQNYLKEALAKYDQALKYAPHWSQLRTVRSTLAAQKI